MLQISLQYWAHAKGLCKEKKKTIRDYYGSGWVGPGLTLNFCVENRTKIALNQY